MVVETRSSILKSLRALVELERMMGADVLPRLGRPAVPSDDWAGFRAMVLSCKLCPLHRTRTNVVFGVGDEKAPLMFIGEAPGEDEDRKGEPFVGRAGILLTKTLQKIGVARERVYIANILKCRPPNNREPQPDEVVRCLPYLKRQIAHIAPSLICTLGRISAQTLLATAESMTRLRGSMREFEGRRLFPTYHPAYILRNMSALPTFEADVREACRIAGLIAGHAR